MTLHNETPEANRAPALTLSGICGGAVLNLLDPVWLERVELDPEPEAPAAPHEIDEIAAKLQLRLGDKTKKQRFPCPPVEDLDALRRDVSRKRYVEHPEGLEHVGNLSEADLNDRLTKIHARLSRGLSHLDLAVIREWGARATGFGYFYGRHDPHLPTQFRELAGRRAPCRSIVLAAMMLAICEGTNSLDITQPEAEKLWGIGASTWWACIAWLEDADLIRRFHTHKNNSDAVEAWEAKGKKGPPPAAVQFAGNVYIPTPRLLDRRAEILAAFGRSDEASNQVARRQLVEPRKARARKIRARANDAKRKATGELPYQPPGEAAPAWALTLIDAAWLAAVRERDDERGRRAFCGVFDFATVGAPEPVDRALDVEQGRQLEALAASRPSDAELARQVRAAAPDPEPVAAGDVAQVVEVRRDEDGGFGVRYGPGALPTLSRPSGRRTPPRAGVAGDGQARRSTSVGRELGPLRPAAGVGGSTGTPRVSSQQLPSNQRRDLPVWDKTEMKQARGHVEPPTPAAGLSGPSSRPTDVERRACPSPATPAADSWGGRDWTSRTQHRDPLAAWADSSNTSTRSTASGGAGALPQGQVSKPTPASSSGARAAAAAELRSQLEDGAGFASSNPEVAAAILATFERFEESDERPPRVNETRASSAGTCKLAEEGDDA